MNWDQVEGKWDDFKVTVRKKWEKLTDEDMQSISGNKDKLSGKLQKRYGFKKTQADSEIEQWSKTLDRDETRH